jgi:hypothetical protein
MTSDLITLPDPAAVAEKRRKKRIKYLRWRKNVLARRTAGTLTFSTF